MSRIDDIKKQNPELDISLIDLISTADPSTTNKYISFLINYLKNGGDKSLSPDEIKKLILSAIYGKNIELLKRFEDHCQSNRIKNKDISKFKKFSDFKEQVLEADEVLRVKNMEKQIIKLFESSEYLVLIPLSYEASRNYGANTKWCVTNEDSWSEYFGEYRLIYVINKKTNVKHAVSLQYDDREDIKCFNQEDDETDFIRMPIPNEVFSVIRTELMKGAYQTEFETLGAEVIVTAERGVVLIENATSEELRQFLRYHNYKGEHNEGFSLPDSFVKHIDEVEEQKNKEEREYADQEYDEEEDTNTDENDFEDDTFGMKSEEELRKRSDLKYFETKKSIFNECISVDDLFSELGIDGIFRLIKTTQ
jgi:hypothetical protein